MKNPFKKKDKQSALERIESWLASHQQGVLLAIVMLVLLVGLTVSQHPTFWLGQLPDPEQGLSVRPNGALKNVDFEVDGDILIAKNISQTVLQDMLSQFKSPLNAGGTYERIEEVFTEGGVTWVMKADSIDPKNQYYDMSFGLYESIQSEQVSTIDENSFTIDVKDKWQFLALLRNQEQDYLQLKALPFQIEAIAEPATLDIVGAPVFLDREEPNFLNITFAPSDNLQMYGVVTVSITNE